MNIVSSNGVSDWLIQRISAVIIAQYSLFLFLYILLTPGLTFTDWTELFNSTLMRIATLIVVLAVITHAWIGLWIVGTDYIKSIAVRLFYQTIVLLVLASLFLWTIEIIWRL